MFFSVEDHVTLHGSDAGSAQKSSAKHLGAKKTPATFCIVSQQKRNQRRTSGLQGATQVSFCVAHSAHIKGLVRHHALPRRGVAAETAGCPGAAGWLAGLASSAMRPVDRQAVPIWPLSGDSPAVFPRSDR